MNYGNTPMPPGLLTFNQFTFRNSSEIPHPLSTCQDTLFCWAPITPCLYLFYTLYHGIIPCVCVYTHTHTHFIFVSGHRILLPLPTGHFCPLLLNACMLLCGGGCLAHSPHFCSAHLKPEVGLQLPGYIYLFPTSVRPKL